MPVSKQEAEQLIAIKNCLEYMNRKGTWHNLPGLHDRVVNILTIDANNGEDIAIAKGYRERIPYPYFSGESAVKRENNRKRFTPKVIEEVAYQESARYFFHELGIKYGWDIGSALTHNIKEVANDENRRRHLDNDGSWYAALDVIAKKITCHWGTPLEAVK